MATLSWKNWPRLVEHLSRSVDLEATAREHGLLRRRRRVGTASDLLRLALAYGPGGQSLRETVAWAEMQGLATLSAPALLYQLRDAADWLEHVAATLLSGFPAATQHARLPLRIIDGSMISAPGTGADWRLHASYDPLLHRFERLELTGRSTAEALERSLIVPGALHIADRVYARPGSLRHVTEQAGDYLVRLGSRSLRLLDTHGKLLILPELLEQATREGRIDMPVVIDRHPKRMARPTASIAAKQAQSCPERPPCGQSKWQPLSARLVILPKPADAAATSRKKALRASQKGMHQPEATNVEAAGYLMLITSLPPDEYPPDDLAAFYRMRWQIEIAFKRLKSLIHIDRLPAKEPRLAKAWLSAHLIIAILIDAITPQLRDSPPSAAKA